MSPYSRFSQCRGRHYKHNDIGEKNPYTGKISVACSWKNKYEWTHTESSPRSRQTVVLGPTCPRWRARLPLYRRQTNNIWATVSGTWHLANRNIGHCAIGKPQNGLARERGDPTRDRSTSAGGGGGEGEREVKLRERLPTQVLSSPADQGHSVEPIRAHPTCKV